MIQPEHVMGGVILLSFAVVYLYMAYYVANDARQRGSELWPVHGVATLLFTLPYAGLYFLIRKDPSK